MCLVGLYIRFETLLEASNRRLVALHHRIVRTPPSSSSCFPSGDGGADLRDCHGRAPRVHLWHGEGPRELPLLLQDRRLSAWRSLLPTAQQAGNPIEPEKIQADFEDFYEDIFDELSKYGEIESLHVCDNLADHMIGNVYVQFREEDQAAKALQALTGRYYSGRPIIVEFSPVTDFREATCRQFEENSCNRGGYCNFMHVKQIGRDLRKRLYGHLHRSRRSHSHGHSRSRSPSPYRYRRDHDRRSSSSRSRDRDDYNYYHGGSRRSSERHHSSYDSDGSRRRHRSRTRSPVREGSEERRARIEQWNRERETAQV
uniref:C3H1-type domain-containing protein n=1 Tax=Leersia perrieri TaxID=77586 RepID=A0A0D9XF58_9ORYZ